MHLKEVRTGPGMSADRPDIKNFQGFSDILERFLKVLDEYSGSLSRAGYLKNRFRVVMRGCGQEFDWQVESEDETKLNILYLLFVNYYAIEKGKLLPEGYQVWRRMNYGGTSPEKLADSRLFSNPTFGPRYKDRHPPLTDALLYALNIRFKEEWRDGKVSALQIAEAWCLAEECGVSFEEALAS